MTLTRITSTVGALAIAGSLGGMLVSSSYGAQAAAPHGPAHHGVARDSGFVAPVLHKYGPNGMRMGLHCETTDMS